MAPSKLQIWVNIVAVLLLLLLFSPPPTTLLQFCIKAGSGRPLPRRLFSIGAAKVPPLPRTRPISMARSKLIEKRLTCFKACWELGARQKPKVAQARHQFAIKGYTRSHVQQSTNQSTAGFFSTYTPPFVFFICFTICLNAFRIKTNIFTLEWQLFNFQDDFLKPV